MTYNECKELLSTFMEAVSRLVDAKLSTAVKSEVGVVRLVDDYNIYVRPSSDVAAPTYSSPTSTSQLDDGDIAMPNISGQALLAGDGVECLYTTSIGNAVIARKIDYSPVSPGESILQNCITSKRGNALPSGLSDANNLITFGEYYYEAGLGIDNLAFDGDSKLIVMCVDYEEGNIPHHAGGAMQFQIGVEFVNGSYLPRAYFRVYTGYVRGVYLWSDWYNLSGGLVA